MYSTDGITWTSFTGPSDSNSKKLVVGIDGIYCFIPGQSYYKITFPKITSSHIMTAPNLSLDNDDRLKKVEGCINSYAEKFRGYDLGINQCNSDLMELFQYYVYPMYQWYQQQTAQTEEEGS